jgi:hypothetical protein
VARNNTIKFLRTTQANLTTQAGSSGLIQGEPYLITDTGALAVGLSSSTYRRCAMVVTNGSIAPTIVGTSTEGVGTYSTQAGSYTRIDRLVSVIMRLAWSAHSGTGNMRIDFSEVPYAPISTTPFPAALYVSGITLTNAHLQAITNGNQLVLQTVASGGSPAAIPIQSSGEVRAWLQYFTTDAF